MAGDILDISDDTFEEEVLKSELPVLVDFWAVWCAPCKMIVPTLEHLAQNYKEKLKVFKMNIDENMKISAKFGIRSIPTLLLFTGGEIKETIVGALPQNKIIDVLSKHI